MVTETLMHRNVLLALTAIFLTLPALACEPGPTPTLPPAQTATATSRPVQPTETATVPPTPSPTPTPTPVAGPIDLGVPAGDAYGPEAMAVDAARGLAYVLSGYGDAAESEEESVLSVVDVERGEVLETVALPVAFRGSTTLALAPAGDRLFIAGGDDYRLMVVATGAGAQPLGQVLAEQSDVRAIALDPVALRLYSVGSEQVRVLDINSMQEIVQATPPATLSPPPAQVLVAVNGQTARLYLGSPNSDIVTVHRVDDLQKVADILPAGEPEEIVSGAGSSQVYLVMRSRQDGSKQVAVIDGNQVTRVWVPQGGFDIRAVVSDDVPDLAYLWGTAQGPESRLRAVDPITGEMVATIPLPTGSITAAVISAGKSYLLTWSSALATVALEDGAVEHVVRLGVTLRDAIVDSATERLLVVDSAGTLHVLDAASLQHVDTLPRAVGRPAESIYAAPLSVVDGRLFVPDQDANETAVLDAATGEQVATIPKAGPATFDASRNRLFVTRQGVFIVDPDTYEIVGSIDETVRKTLFSGEPSAIAAQYDAAHDLLFVTMSNNSPGSSSSTWLQVYDGEALQRLDTPIKTDRQFLAGLAVDPATDLVYVASSFPTGDLAVFTTRGELLRRLQYLTGELFLDAGQQRLYVTGWDGLASLDTATHDVVDYRRLTSNGYREFTTFDPVHRRFYTTLSNSADLQILRPEDGEPVAAQVVGRLPAKQIRYLAAAADGALLASSDDGSAYRQVDGGWRSISGGLPPLGWPVVHPARGVPGVLFAHLRQPGNAYGLFRSEDGGQTWQPAVRGLKDLDVRDLALSPGFANDRTAVLLSGEDGVFRTTDGGETWQPVSEVAGQYVALAAAAAGPPTFLVLARKPDVYDKTYVYAPAGATGDLEQIGSIPSAVLPGSDALALSPDFARDGVAIAGLYQAGLFLSRDSGHTWRQLPPRPEAFSVVYTVRFSPDFASDRTVYALMAPSYFGPEDRSVLVRSTDGGETWQRAVDADPLISALAMGPAGDLWVGDAPGDVRPLDPAQLYWEIAREPPPTPVPTPSEPPAGFYPPEGAFAELWATDPDVRQALGWTAEPEPRQTAAAFQPFEGGVMIWRGDTRTIYVLYDDGSWDAFEDTWTPDQPERDPNIQAPAGREQPVRGFGKVWRERPGVRERLGWALRSEEAYSSPVQGFERGTAMGVGASVYVLTRVAGEPATWLER